MRSRPTAEIVADGAAVTLGCIAIGILLISDGTNDPTAVLYDNTAASGTKIGEYSFDVSVKGSFVEYFPIPNVVCYKGVYVDLTGTGASCIIYHVPTGGQD